MGFEFEHDFQRPHVSTKSGRLIERGETHAYDRRKAQRLTLDEYEVTELGLKSFTTDRRKALSKQGKALPDGSFPIESVDDLKNAIRAFGRAGNKARAKGWIKARARALGRTDLLPANW